MMKHHCLIFVIFALLLTGCGRGISDASLQNSLPEKPSESPSQSASSNVQTDKFLDAEYPLANWNWQWVDDNTVAAMDAHGNVNYIDANNNPIYSGSVDSQYVNAGIRTFFGKEIFFISHNTVEEDLFYTCAFKSDGEWHLYNGSFHSVDGAIIRKLPKLTYKYNEQTGLNDVIADGKDVSAAVAKNSFPVLIPLEHSLWIDDDTLVLQASRMIFFYNVSTDKLTLAEDFTDELPCETREDGYYGIGNIVPFKNGILYSVSDIIGEYNTKCHIYFNDGINERQSMFGEEIYTVFSGQNGIATAMEIIDSEDGTYTKSTRLSILTESKELKQLDFEGHARLVAVYKRADGYRLVFENSTQESDNGFCVFDIIGDKLKKCEYRPKITNMFQYELVAVTGDYGKLKYYFSALEKDAIDGNPKTFRYDEVTGELSEASRFYKAFTDIKVNDSVYLDGGPDEFNPEYIKIVPIR